MNTLLRNLNTLLLAGILAMLILVALRMPPVAARGPDRIMGGQPIPVRIENEPLQVEITR